MALLNFSLCDIQRLKIYTRGVLQIGDIETKLEWSQLLLQTSFCIARQISTRKIYQRQMEIKYYQVFSKPFPIYGLKRRLIEREAGLSRGSPFILPQFL